MRTPRNMLLVVQTPRCEGAGHDFLVTRMELSKFDRSMWEKGKSDELILVLAHMIQHGVGQCRTEIDMKTLVQSIQERHEEVEQVELDFALPTLNEVANAVLRMNRTVITEQITQLEKRIDGCGKFIASTEAKLNRYRTYLKQPKLLTGIRLHYKHVLIADCEKDLRDVRNERERTLRDLKHTRTLQKSFDTKEEN